MTALLQKQLGETRTGSQPYDSRFRRLIGADSWQHLRPAIRARFSKRLGACAVALYAGEIVETRFTLAGRLLAQACRLIGSPLPLFTDQAVPAVVIVSEDGVTGGQRWTRVYHRARGNPQVINSAKSFSGPTGLEEHIGRGFGMALIVRAEADRLVFTSDHYFWAAGRFRLRLPRWPGTTIVTHRDLGEGRFAFDLELCHSWFGLLVHQHALFADQ
jgi:hypothetical protein